MNKPAHPRTTTLILLPALLAGAGCGKDDQVAVNPVAGTISQGGKPVAKAMILFQPTAPKTPEQADAPEHSTLVAETDQEGKYSLSTYTANDGAPAGDYLIAIRPLGNGPSVEESDGPVRPSRARSPISTKYAKTESSPLKATVAPGENKLDFELDPGK
jgi:hypothetical protein